MSKGFTDEEFSRLFSNVNAMSRLGSGRTISKEEKDIYERLINGEIDYKESQRLILELKNQK